MGYSWGIVRGKFKVGNGATVDLETLLSRWQKFCSDGYADDFYLPIEQNLYHFKKQNFEQADGAVDVSVAGNAQIVLDDYAEKLAAAKLDNACPNQSDLDTFCREGSTVYVPSVRGKFLYIHEGRDIYQYEFPPYKRIDEETARNLQYGYRCGLDALYRNRRRKFEKYIHFTAEFCREKRLMFEFVYDTAAFE